MAKTTHRTAWLAASLTLIGALATARARAAEPVLAVLYVDNHSGDARYDVLRKGLADMLVTDLAAQGLTVVERARLQALLDEQALQATDFVDPKTAVRVGQGLGATHVVGGSLMAVAPRVRLDLHMIDVATGQVTVAASADGRADELFDVEQRLVARFVEALAKKARAVAMPRTKVKDPDSLLDYARGLDLADRGELERAREAFDAAVKRSPAFGLARLRQAELRARLEASGERRERHQADARAELAAAAEAALSRPAGAPEAAARRLGWRGVRARLRAAALVELVSAEPLGVAKPGREAELLAAERALADDLAAFVKELDDLRAADARGAVRYDFGEDEARRLRELGLGQDFADTPGEARRALARFVLLGEAELGSRSLTVAPPLGRLDPSWEARAFAALDEAARLADAQASRPGGEHDVVQTAELVADARALRGETEAAVDALQRVLDRLPGSSSFERLERRIRQLLGLELDATGRGLEAWSRGLAGCIDLSLRVGLDTVSYQRLRLHGLAGLDALVAEVEGACRDAASARQFWSYLYAHVGRAYGKHLRCDRFEAWMARSVAAGGSAGDVAGWRKNWTSCPSP